ncbi:uncharacterized protein LOC132744608 [Ruditapes philippinarum]|uniref:uncharacterized protein LOC132744608 n=1 Tax=Ruditapes philippinarum TaxID=129788 RepID=UPI00295ABB71|nr:uncharacterized protein LOC132744608 [Ruditapes philippinarum]
MILPSDKNMALIMYINIYLIISFLVIFPTAVTKPLKGCDPEPVDALFFIHGTSMAGNQRNVTEQLVRDITSSLHKDSKKNFYLLTDTAKELVVDSNLSEDTVINKIFAEDIKSVTESTTISSEAINNVLASTFSVNQYKNRAEFVILLVTNQTELDAVSPFLEKKKTVVVVLGSSIPNIFKSVASYREDYLYQVGSFEDLEMVIGKIKERIACDSNKYCDTDTYSTKKGSRCKSCEGPCEQKTDICTKYCLFERPKPDLGNNTKSDFVYNKSEPNTMTTIARQGAKKDNKDLAVTAILIVFAAVCLLALGIGIVRYCWGRSSRQLTPGSSDETIRKTPASSETHSLDKFPVQAMDESDPLMEIHGQVAENDQAEGMASNEISVDLKNNQEWDLNVHGARDQYQALHSPV